MALEHELYLSTENLHKAYSNGSINPASVIDIVYSRIAAYHDKAVWITLVSRDDALEKARQLVQRYPNAADRPPLFGIPFSVKDSIDIANMPTTLACPSYA